LESCGDEVVLILLKTNFPQKWCKVQYYPYTTSVEVEVELPPNFFEKKEAQKFPRYGGNFSWWKFL